MYIDRPGHRENLLNNNTMTGPPSKSPHQHVMLTPMRELEPNRSYRDVALDYGELRSADPGVVCVSSADAGSSRTGTAGCGAWSARHTQLSALRCLPSGDVEFDMSARSSTELPQGSWSHSLPVVRYCQYTTSVEKCDMIMT